MDWQEVGKAIGQTAVIVTAGAWLVRTLITHFLSLDVENYKRSLQVSSTREIEQFKNDLLLAAHERTTTFVQLHTKRSEVIEKLYEYLVAAEEGVDIFLDPRIKSTDPGADEAYHRAFDALRDLSLYFRRHRIHLSPDLCIAIDEALKKLHGPAWAASYFYLLPTQFRPASSEERQEKVKQWSQFKSDVPPILTRVEEEFRRVLGGSLR